MTTHSSDVFDAFIAAKAAMDKVPQLEGEISRLTGSIDIANEIIKIQGEEKSNIQNELDIARSKLANLEASLDSSRKSNEELSARLDLIVGTLRDLGGSIGTALSVVEPPKPEPEPMPEPTVTEPTTMTTAVHVEDYTTVASTPTVTVAEPADSKESYYRDIGQTWFDTAGNVHRPNDTAEAPAAPSVPFAASTESQSPVAASTAPTSTTEPPAPQSDAASLPESVHLRRWGNGNGFDTRGDLEV